MLHATNFYQNCVDEDTESRWMEVFEEQKAIGQASSDSILTAGNDQETEVIISKSVTTIEMGNPKINTDSTFLEKTHSAETKIDGKFRTSLQRCHEMENIDKVAYQ
uniref:Uncharacterized protein n=1 Tax=Setaria digitata TaxID=48799 RepID=A0A915PV98_9BILA